MQIKSKWIEVYEEPGPYELGDGWKMTRVEYCPVVKEYLNSLNLKEISNDIEAYDTMHMCDGIVGRSTSPSKL